MDQFPESNDNHNMNGHDSEHNHNLNISPNPDGTRKPQLNSSVKGHGGSSQGCQDIGEGGDGDGDGESSFGGDYDTMIRSAYLDAGNVSDDEDDPIGQEGVEPNQLAPPEPATPGCRCSCHQATWVRDPLFDFSPPSCSGMHSPSSSVLGVRDSAETSLENSVVWDSASPVPSEQNYIVRSIFIDEAVFQPTSLLRFSLVYNPLALSPESLNFYDDDE